MVLNGVGAGKPVDVIVQIDREGKMHLTGRSGDVIVKGEVSQA